MALKHQFQRLLNHCKKTHDFFVSPGKFEEDIAILNALNQIAKLQHKIVGLIAKSCVKQDNFSTQFTSLSSIFIHFFLNIEEYLLVYFVITLLINCSNKNSNN